LSPATQSNAGMAKRHGDVVLREAQVSAPIRTLAWLGLADLLGVGRVVCGEQQRSTFQRPVSKVFFCFEFKNGHKKQQQNC